MKRSVNHYKYSNRDDGKIHVYLNSAAGERPFYGKWIATNSKHLIPSDCFVSACEQYYRYPVKLRT